MSFRKIVFLFLVSLFAIQPAQSSDGLDVDLSLIRPYTRQLQSQSPYRAPYVTIFEKGQKTLVYVAAAHQQGIESATARTIKMAFAEAKPQVVLIEGLDIDHGISPKFFQDLVLRDEPSQFKNSGENLIAALFAMRANIPFLGAEPSNRDVYPALAAKGYAESDVTAFIILRNVPYWVRRDNVNDSSLDARIQNFIDNWRYYALTQVPREKRLTPGQFRDWFARHRPAGMSLMSITSNDLAPISTPDATWFQTMSALMDDVREQSIDRQIARLIHDYDRVFVVYGEAHLMKSRPVFEKILGLGRDRKLSWAE